MGTIAAPNIAELGGQIAQAPMNQAAEYARVAALKQQTAASQQQMQQQAAMAPGAQQLQQQQVQSGQLSLQEQQREAQDAQAVRDAYKNSGGDLDKFQQNMVTAGVGPKASLAATTMINGMRTSVNNLGESDLKLVQTKHEQLAPLIDTVLQAAPESQAALWTAQINDAAKRGLITPQEAAQHAQYPGPDGVKIYSNSLKTVDQLMKERQEDIDQQKANQGDWKEGGGGTLVNVNPKSPQFGKIVRGAGPVDQQEMNSYLTADKVPGEVLPPEQRTPASFVFWKAKQSPMAVVMGNMLKGPAIDQAAERYSTDGTLPSGFARSPGTTAAIIQRSAELHPEQNLATNKATFQADTGALKQVQKQFDVMNAFEGTALRNLDLYAQTAAKIPDLGARFANVPLRMITGSMIGADNMAALKAARETAATEVAKVLGSATGSGVLSDSQKKEAQDVIDGNLPLSATLAVVNTLKQDMANRHQSYQADIDAIKGRLGAKPGAAQPGGGNQGGGNQQNDFFSQFGGKSR